MKQNATLGGVFLWLLFALIALALAPPVRATTVKAPLLELNYEIAPNPIVGAELPSAVALTPPDQCPVLYHAPAFRCTVDLRPSADVHFALVTGNVRKEVAPSRSARLVHWFRVSL